MYKKLIIGFAFMVPDVNHDEAYISFIYTHPEWRGAGIASIMLYHLIQVLYTLHTKSSHKHLFLPFLLLEVAHF